MHQRVCDAAAVLASPGISIYFLSPYQLRGQIRERLQRQVSAFLLLLLHAFVDFFLIFLQRLDTLLAELPYEHFLCLLARIFVVHCIIVRCRLRRCLASIIEDCAGSAWMPSQHTSYIIHFPVEYQPCVVLFCDQSASSPLIIDCAYGRTMLLDLFKREFLGG